MAKAQSKIAFFDFDGTLTTKDSLADFIQFSHGRTSYYVGLLAISPSLVLYALGLTNNQLAKERLIRYFFGGWDYQHFQEIADRYSAEQIDKITRAEAMKKLDWHKNHGHEIVVVSASMEAWLQTWCEKRSIDLIATRLEIQNGKLTGKFAGKNCNGSEKASRILQQYDLDAYETVYAYGDSAGDKKMLDLADQKYYRCFY